MNIFFGFKKSTESEDSLVNFYAIAVMNKVDETFNRLFNMAEGFPLPEFISWIESVTTTLKQMIGINGYSTSLMIDAFDHSRNPPPVIRNVAFSNPEDSEVFIHVLHDSYEMEADSHSDMDSLISDVMAVMRAFSAVEAVNKVSAVNA